MERTDRDDDPVKIAVRLGAETRDIEYKSSHPFDTYRWKLVKACMALANLRNGGIIVIGMAESPEGGYIETGVEAAHIATYSQDALYALVNRHARPVVSLALRFVTIDERRFIGIEVAPFDRVPIFCGVATPPAATGNDALRIGDIPGRTRDRISTSRVGDPDVLAEILEIAAEKRAAEIIATAQRIGLRLPDNAAAARLERERAQFFGER